MSAMLCVFMMSSALAASGASIDSDGVVVGTAEVAAPAGVVRKVLGDARAVAAITAAGTSVEQVSVEGGCAVLDYTSVNRLATVAYRVRQCPVDGGFDAALISSSSFTAYATSWRVEAVGEGTRITYRLSAKTSLPVPKAIIRYTMRGAVEDMMSTLEEHFDQ
jgi:carbon monoxide dehydrogenase subunit G